MPLILGHYWPRKSWKTFTFPYLKRSKKSLWRIRANFFLNCLGEVYSEASCIWSFPLEQLKIIKTFKCLLIFLCIFMSPFPRIFLAHLLFSSCHTVAHGIYFPTRTEIISVHLLLTFRFLFLIGLDIMYKVFEVCLRTCMLPMLSVLFYRSMFSLDIFSVV